MTKQFLSAVGIISLLAVSGPIFGAAAARPSVESDVIGLGSRRDPQSGKIVQGYAIIHFKRGYHHRPGHAGGPGGNGGTDTSSCYAVLSNGAKWKTVEPWEMNTSNTRGLNGNTLFSTQSSALAKWETAASSEIFGSGAHNNSATLNLNELDGKNTVVFGNIGSPGAIAVTNVWGYFSGPPRWRELVEWDQVYDDADFDWSLSGEANKMDFDNIATHENGHAAGLGHPSDSCTEETMYRFASEGETKKRSLEAGDIVGINSLY